MVQGVLRYVHAGTASGVEAAGTSTIIEALRPLQADQAGV
jgi:hypothetical protein